VLLQHRFALGEECPCSSCATGMAGEFGLNCATPRLKGAALFGSTSDACGCGGHPSISSCALQFPATECLTVTLNGCRYGCTTR
jgi:hypothetical protein